MPAIRAVGLHKTYGAGNTEVRALRGVSVAVERGKVLALLGPSGSGKSTLLTALGLLQLPERGTLELDGRLVVRDGAALEDLASLRRSRLGFVFQRSNLIPFLTAEENVALTLDLNAIPARDGKRRARELLEYLGMGDRMGSYPDELSGGQSQRVAIARALAAHPAVVLADEPTAALDGPRGRSVMELFRKIAREQGTAVVVVTHDHRTLDLIDEAVEMEDGELRTALPATA